MWSVFQDENAVLGRIDLQTLDSGSTRSGSLNYQQSFLSHQGGDEPGKTTHLRASSLIYGLHRLQVSFCG
jgi:hypothetical protein